MIIIFPHARIYIKRSLLFLNIYFIISSRGGGGYRGGGGGYDRRDHGGYRGGGGHDRYRRSPSPYHRRDDYRRRSRSRSHSPRKLNMIT